MLVDEKDTSVRENDVNINCNIDLNGTEQQIGQLYIKASANREDFSFTGTCDSKTGYTYVASWTDVRPQILICTLLTFVHISCGTNLAYPNLFLESVDLETVSWIASVGAVTFPIGAVISSLLADKYGRRNTIIISGIPCVIAWLIFVVADVEHVYLLIAARAIGGVTVGLVTVVFVFGAEICDQQFRPLLLSMIASSVSFGIMMTTILGAFFTWKGTAVIYAALFSLITLLTVLYVPESPYWYSHFRPNHMDKARRNLRQLTTNQQVFENHWIIMKRNMELKSVETNSTAKFVWKFKNPEVYKPIVLLIILQTLQQICGGYPVIFYAKKMLPVIGGKVGKHLNRETFVIFGITRFIGTVLSCILSKRFGRKEILIYSSIMMTILWVALILSFEFIPTINRDNANAYNGYLNILIFLCYVGVSSIGILTVPWTLVSELLPVPVKSIGTSISHSYAYLMMFFVTKLFPHILDNIRLSYLFTFFALISLIIAIFTYYFIPETLGKSMDEISEYFIDDGKKNLKRSVNKF